MYAFIRTYIYARMQACMHLCMLANMASMHAYIGTCIHAYMHTCIHAYMHTCIHAYTQAYLHT